MVSGHVTTKNGKLYIILNYIDNDKKRQQKWIKTGLSVRGNKRKAEEMLELYREHYDIEQEKLVYPTETLPKKDEIKNEPINEAANILFGDYLMEWLEGLKNTLEISTYAGYKAKIQNIIAPYFAMFSQFSAQAHKFSDTGSALVHSFKFLGDFFWFKNNIL